MDNMPQITLADENGNEKDYYVVFSFDRQDGVRHYTIYSDYEEDAEGLVTFQAMYQDEGEEPGTFHSVEEESDWELVEQVMETFQED